MFEAFGPLQFLFVIILAFAPVILLIWVTAQIAGIRRALDRLVDVVESRSTRDERL